MRSQNFGKKIRALREARHWTIEETAKRLGFRAKNIQLWETTNWVPGEGAEHYCVDKMAKLFNVPSDYLLDDSIHGPSEYSQLRYIEKKLAKLNNDELQMVEKLLNIVFPEVFCEDTIDEVLL